LKEQYKRVRVKNNPDGSLHIGDTRTKEETAATMNANKKGARKWLKINFPFFL